MTTLAETNRAPFDFAEGESELVSGFNTEYRRGGFAVLFVAEYANILFIRLLTATIFFGAQYILAFQTAFMIIVKTMLFAFFFL